MVVFTNCSPTSSYVFFCYLSSVSPPSQSITDVIKIKKNTLASISPYLSKPDEQGAKMIEGIGKWDFDLFAADEMSGGKALVVVGTVLFNEHDLLSVFKIKPDVLENFLQAVSDAYIADNTYHNALHGADVTQTLHYFIQTGGVGSYLTREMLFTCIVAALIHDCGHPGVNNAFRTVTAHPAPHPQPCMLRPPTLCPLSS